MRITVLWGLIAVCALSYNLHAAVAVAQPAAMPVLMPSAKPAARKRISQSQLKEYQALLERNIKKIRDYLAQTNIPATDRVKYTKDLDRTTERLARVHERISLLPVTAKIAEGTHTPETPGEKAIQKMVESHVVQPHKIQVLLAARNPYELLGDGDLAQEFKFAMGDTASVQHAIMIRRAVLEPWKIWNTNVLESGKDAVARYKNLYEKVSSELRSHYPNRSAALAHIVIKAPLGDAAFAQEMVHSIVGRQDKGLPSYRKLLNMILGFDFTQSEYHRQAARKINGNHINDIQCSWQILARILIAYREQYCQRFLTASEMFFESFIEQNKGRFPQLAEWVAEWKKDAFLDPLAQQQRALADEQKEAHGLWVQGVIHARGQAHTEARDSLNTMLAEVLQAMRLLHARLDVLSVGDHAFGYPHAQATGPELDPAGKKSLLIGILRGCVEQRFAKRRALTPTVLHAVFYSELVGQTTAPFKHVKQLPQRVDVDKIREANEEADEGKNLLSLRMAAYIRAYLGRKFLTISSPAMDIMSGEADQEDRGLARVFSNRYVQVALEEELRPFNVPMGMQLYAHVLDLRGELNAIRWGLPTKMTHQAVMAKLVSKLHQVSQYVRALFNPVVQDLKRDINDRYASEIQKMVPWKRLKNVKYEDTVTLRSMLDNDSLSTEQRQEAYRSAYRVLWMCIWKNLQRLVSRNGNQFQLPSFGSIPVAEEVAVSDTTKIPVAEVAPVQRPTAEPSTAFAGLQSQFSNIVDTLEPTFQGVGSDVDAIRNELIGNFKDTGDYSGVVNNANRMLGRIGSLLPSFNAMMVEAHGHTEGLVGQMRDHSDRLLAAMKGMMLYGYWLNRYTDTKIRGLQEMLSELLNSSLLRLGMRFKLIRGKLVRAMEHVSENDQSVLKEMRGAWDKTRKGWTGELTAAQIPPPPGS